MSTTAMVEVPKTAYLKSTIMPEGKSTRQIVKEEIQRQKALDELETKYKNGEISNFEYKAGKFLLNLPETKERTLDPTLKYCIA